MYSTAQLIAHRAASRKVAHQERIQKIASHALGVASNNIRAAYNAKTAAPKIPDVLQPVIKHVSDNPGAYIGGSVGAVGGAAVGAASGGRGKRLGRAIAGALLGGGAGAGAGYGYDRYSSNELDDRGANELPEGGPFDRAISERKLRVADRVKERKARKELFDQLPGPSRLEKLISPLKSDKSTAAMHDERLSRRPKPVAQRQTNLRYTP